MSRTIKKVAKGEEETYQMICNFIGSHLEEDLSLERLSNQFFLNKYYIAHLFKDKVGMSAHQYITRKRLDACKDAILGDEPIGQICQQFGFSDYTSFLPQIQAGIRSFPEGIPPAASDGSPVKRSRSADSVSEVRAAKEYEKIKSAVTVQSAEL